jgi:protein-tyrosine phosphatase
VTDIGHEIVEHAARDLHWPDCLNVRDLGGLPTQDGGAIRRGALIRADALSRLTDDGVAAARAAGVSRIIDLRRPAEAGSAAHPFGADPVYRNIPVQNPADPDHQWLTLTEIYCTMLDLRPDLFAQAFAAVADAPPGAVVVHCAGGKDRTGIITAFALSVAGVSDDVIAADYALTEERLREDSAAYLELIDDPKLRTIVAGLQPTPPTVMLDTLAHVRERHGGVRAYLVAARVTESQLAAVHDRLVA